MSGSRGVGLLLRGAALRAAGRSALALWIAAILLSAAYLPRVRELLAAHGGVRPYLATALALLAATAVGFAFWKTWERRSRTLGALTLLALAGGLGWSLLANPDPRARFIEAAHLAEYGVLGFLVFRASGRWAVSFLWGVAVGLVDETVQWIIPARTGEIRDVVLNALSGGLGASYARIVLGNTSQTWMKREASSLIWSGGLLVLGTAFFLNAAQRGHLIEWGGISFRSQFTERELERIAAERRVRWAGLSEEERGVVARPDRSIWGVEDFFVTETLRHVQARNDASDHGDLGAAVSENLILERWYEPAADVLSARRRDLQGEPTVPYASPALFHLWTWLTPMRLWGTVALAGVVLIAVRFLSPALSKK